MAFPNNTTGPGSANTTNPGMKDQVTDQFDKLADRASRSVHDAAGQAQDFANKAADEMRHVGGNVQQVAGNMQDAMTRSVKDQPMATLAMVAVMGFVLGAIWKS